MTQYLTSAMTHNDDGTGNNDIAEFERLFPSAAAWLTGRSLLRERDCLRAELGRLQEFQRKWVEKFGQSREFWDQGRLTWVEKRVAELNGLTL